MRRIVIVCVVSFLFSSCSSYPPTSDQQVPPIPSTASTDTTSTEWGQYHDPLGVSFEYAADRMVCPFDQPGVLFFIKGITTCPPSDDLVAIQARAPEIQLNINSTLYGDDPDYDTHVNKLRSFNDDEYNKNFDLHEITIDGHKTVCYNYNSEMGGNGVMYEIYLPAHSVVIRGAGTYREDCSGASLRSLQEIVRNFSE